MHGFLQRVAKKEPLVGPGIYIYIRAVRASPHGSEVCENSFIGARTASSFALISRRPPARSCGLPKRQRVLITCFVAEARKKPKVSKARRALLEQALFIRTVRTLITPQSENEPITRIERRTHQFERIASENSLKSLHGGVSNFQFVSCSNFPRCLRDVLTCLIQRRSTPSHQLA